MGSDRLSIKVHRLRFDNGELTQYERGARGDNYE